MNKLSQLLKQTWSHWREMSLVYFIQLVLGSIVSITFYIEVKKHLGQSLALDHLARGFDRTVLTDLVYSNGEILSATKNIGLLVLGVYILVGVFLQAGWLANIRTRKFSISSLVGNGRKYVVPFLGLGLISVLLVGLVGGIGAFIFTSIVGDPLVTFSSEKPYVLWIAFLVILLVFWSISVWSWSVASRCHFINGTLFFKSLGLGLRSVLAQWFKFQAIGFLIVGIHVLFMFSYYWVMGDRGAPSWFVVVGGIAVQQIFNFLRIVLRGFGFSCVSDLVKD